MNKPLLYALYSLLAIASILPRVTTLDAFTSPDEAQWERNTQGFGEALKTGDLKGFYQQPHPGITTQWLAVATIEKPTWGEKRMPLALFLGLFVLYITYILRRGWGDAVALTGGFLLALNPLLIAHSRVLAMDALLGVFMIAAFIHHLLWIRDKRNVDIASAGIFTALAILSKLSAVEMGLYVLIASSIALVTKQISLKEMGKGALLYTAGLLGATVIIFPTLFTNFSHVLQGSLTFFATEHFTQLVHALGPWWYPQAFLLWSTPLQLLCILLIPIALWKKTPYRLPLILCIVFCVIFFLEIQYSIKKGDRYMLPVFLGFDILSTFVLAAVYRILSLRSQKYAIITVAVMFIGGIAFQAHEAIRLHPYLLAYRNPFFASVADGRTMGWGEGLDLAAEYLNTKPDAEHLLVAAYYEGSFGYHFKGEFTSVERLAKESEQQIGADYVVLYRTMEGRAPERWETKVLAEYKDKTPEKIISLNGEEYVWIYKTNR